MAETQMEHPQKELVQAALGSNSRTHQSEKNETEISNILLMVDTRKKGLSIRKIVWFLL